MWKGTECFLFRPPILLQEIKSRSSIFVLIAIGTAAATTRRKKQQVVIYKGADKSLARPGRKQATGTEDFEFHIFYL